MNTLIVHRDWQSTYNQITVLKDNNNKVKVIINGYLKQPKLLTKTIVIRGIEYSLDWGLVLSQKRKIKTDKK